MHESDLFLVEDLLLLGEGFHPELDVPQHVNGADASLVLADDLVTIIVIIRLLRMI